MSEPLAEMPQQVSRFELRLQDHGQGHPGPDGLIPLDTQVWIDGECVSEPQFVDVPWLINSLLRPGHYDFMACGCGLREDGSRWCGYRFSGIDVMHKGDFVRWRFRLPQCEDDELSNPREEPVVMYKHLFRRAQMRDAIESYMAAVRLLVQDRPGLCAWPIEGCTVEELLARDLDTWWQPGSWSAHGNGPARGSTGGPSETPMQPAPSSSQGPAAGREG